MEGGTGEEMEGGTSLEGGQTSGNLVASVCTACRGAITALWVPRAAFG